MNRSKSWWFRVGPIIVALAALLLTGCGGGGGGGNPVAPIGGGDPVGSIGDTTIEGYVSNAAASLRAAQRLAAPPRPLTGAMVAVLTFDASGSERLLGSAVAGDDGHYRVVFPGRGMAMRNLVVRATAGQVVVEGVVPTVAPGLVNRAPTIDPGTVVQARIIREAARIGRHEQVNVGEVMTLLPPDALQQVEAERIPEVVNAVVARDEALVRQAGDRAQRLKDFAFALQARINREIEAGTLAPADAWQVFDRELRQQALALGIDTTTLDAANQLGQAQVDRAIAGTNAAGVAADDRREWLRRNREDQLSMVDMLSESFRTLAAERTDREFAAAMAILTRLRTGIDRSEGARGLAELLGETPDMMAELCKSMLRAIELTGLSGQDLDRILGRVGPAEGVAVATPNGVQTVLADGTVTAGGGAGAATPGQTMVALADPAGTAIGFENRREKGIEALIERVTQVAASRELQLDAAKIKAVATMLWVAWMTNCWVPVEPVTPVEPDPDAWRQIVLDGTLERLETVETIDHEAVQFTHGLRVLTQQVYPIEIIGDPSLGLDDGREPSQDPAGPGRPASGGTSQGAAAGGATGSAAGGGAVPGPMIAWLGASGPIEIVAAGADGREIVGRGSLDDVLARGASYVQVEGVIAGRPRIEPVPMPQPVPVPGDDQSLDPNRPVAGDADGVVTTAARARLAFARRARRPADAAVSAVESEDNTYVTNANGVAVEIPKCHVVVRRVRLLPPPPPPPVRFHGVTGRIVAATVEGRPVPGICVFVTAAAAVDGAVLRSYGGANEAGSDAFARWVGQTVRLAGVVISETGGQRWIHAISIEPATAAPTP